jgi:hypothetical protein
MSSPAALVQQVHELVDRLAALDPASLPADEQQQLVMALQRETSRLAVVTADALVPWRESGVRRAGGTLRPELAIARDARRDRLAVVHELRRARVLDQLPLVRQATLDGRLSIDHVDLFVRHHTKARAELFRRCEQWLVDRCAGHDLFDDAARDVKYWAMWADDQLGIRREPSSPSTLYASTSEVTGDVLIDGHLNPVDGHIVMRELRRLADELRLQDRRDGVERTPAQRRAAALTRMAARSVGAEGTTARPLFEVLIGDETARHLCELATGAVVAPEDLAPFIDAAVMQTFLFDARHAVVGVSSQRTFRGALRRAIKVRDRRCQHASVCPTPAADCDVDHRTPAARGGPTSQFNGRLQCRTHNRDPEVHGHPEPFPNHQVTGLDLLRAKARWVRLRDVELEDAADAATPPRGPFTPSS